MGIKFLGTPVKAFDRLCSEEEKVVIEVKCFKSEEIGYHQPDGSIKFVTEDVQTYGYGRQIFSWRDIFQTDDEDDYPEKKDISDSVREKLR